MSASRQPEVKSLILSLVETLSKILADSCFDADFDHLIVEKQRFYGIVIIIIIIIIHRQVLYSLFLMQ